MKIALATTVLTTCVLVFATLRLPGQTGGCGTYCDMTFKRATGEPLVCEAGPCFEWTLEKRVFT